MRYRRLTKQGRSSKGASSGRIFGLGNRACRVYQVKDRLRCSIGQWPTELDAMWTPQSDGKRERLCFIERKDNSFVSNRLVFSARKHSHFSTQRKEKQKHGDFFSIRPLFLSSLPLFLWSPSCSGEKSVVVFSLHSAFVPFPVPQVSAPSRMTPSHAGTRTRALRTQQVSTFLPSPITLNLLNYCSLGVKIFAFPLSAPEGEGSSPKPSPTKCCCSTICAHRVKR
mgnify:CR=1 FL=1